ncbi:hypothetical protein FQN57_006888 [Myotisia sp. PD_48]|nr:hypothetical protein FQN57_006888 [Myotisia sp. PD_48]
MNCGLCDTAKITLAKLREQKSFDYAEIDVMAPGNKAWKDLYEFDVPVLHVERGLSPKDHNAAPTKEVKRLFHRFTGDEVKKAMDG